MIELKFLTGILTITSKLTKSPKYQTSNLTKYINIILQTYIHTLNIFVKISFSIYI